MIFWKKRSQAEIDREVIAVAMKNFVLGTVEDIIEELAARASLDDRRPEEPEFEFRKRKMKELILKLVAGITEDRLLQGEKIQKAA